MADMVPVQPAMQAAFPFMYSIETALEQLANADVETRGAIFTRREVVDFILDLAGYVTDKPLHEQTIMEPSFGGGDFLLVVVERLLDSWKRHGRRSPTEALAKSIRAVELHRKSYEDTRHKVVNLLHKHGISMLEAERLVSDWLIHGDYLLTPFSMEFDYVIGNPPYVRQELIPGPLLAEYRARYCTVYDRADIYVPFIERSLSLLCPGGSLGFICANRWMKNRYGGPLRQMIAERFHLKIYVDMVDTPAFHSSVIAYPAITILTREDPGSTKIARRPEIQPAYLRSLADELLNPAGDDRRGQVQELMDVAVADQPWVLEASDRLTLVRRLEREFPTIEMAGCKVGIGVATGADKVFIGPMKELDVEESRKLPLAMTRDILSGEVQWRGLGVINPFDEEGRLVDLAEFPRLQRYLLTHKDRLTKRHVAQKSSANWYKTIDRIQPALTHTPKLLIPDIKGEAHIVYESGHLYPHHNLYFITSDAWDLRALQAVLLSGIARLFVETYSTRMQGGCLRFQAQYLRRIRLPRWSDVPLETQRALIDAAAGDKAACNSAVKELYGLTTAEQATLGLLEKKEE